MNIADEPKWISLELAIAIHNRQLSEHGGQAGVRDEGLLLSALARPQQRWCYGNSPPDILALAASYAFGISKNHPFLDGNKRTAFVVFRLFLKWNGYEIFATKAERYIQMLALAAGEHDEESFTAWLREVTKPKE